MKITRAPWLAVVVFLAALPASARELRFGVVGGGTFTKIPGIGAGVVSEGAVTALSVKRLSGFSAGGAFELGFAIGSLRLEPRYIQKGTTFTVTATDRRTNVAATSSGDVEMTYVDVPLLFRSEFLKSKPVQIYMMSGVGPNFLIEAKVGSRDVKGSFKDVEMGVISSLGLMRKTDRALLSADIRLASTINRLDKGTDPKAKVRSTGIQFVISIVFNAKK